MVGVTLHAILRYRANFVESRLVGLIKQLELSTKSVRFQLWNQRMKDPKPSLEFSGIYLIGMKPLDESGNEFDVSTPVDSFMHSLDQFKNKNEMMFISIKTSKR